MFCSVSAVSPTHAFHQEQEIVLVKQAMLRSARTKVLLVDHGKLQRTALHRLAPLTDFDVVIVDEKTPADLIQSSARPRRDRGGRHTLGGEFAGMDIGVDVGTTVTKAVAFDDDGRQVAEASRPTRLVRPGPGRFEHDTDEIVASVNEVVGGAASAAVGNATRASSRSPRRATACGWSIRTVRPVRPAISWLDARSSAILERWTADGVAEQVFRRSGNRMFPGASGPAAGRSTG